jgi:hypothetical protein
MATTVRTFAAEEADPAAGLFASVFNAAPGNERWRLDRARGRFDEMLHAPG